MDGILHRLEPCDHRLSIHGLAVQVLCEVPHLNWPIHNALGEFSTSVWPEGFSPVPGLIRAYDESAVMRHLSPQAAAIASDDLMEIYEHDERFWIVDDRWGIAEINLLKLTWQSWVLSRPAINAGHVTEAAVLWPLAQLLRAKGLTLLPAAAVARDGFGVLILSPFGIEPELTALASSGWGIVGQRWTALREEDGRVSMLRMPGQIERVSGPRYRGTDGQFATTPTSTWIDLTLDRPGCSQHHAYCDAVVVVDAARRGRANSKPIKGAGTAGILKKAWPIFDLHVPSRQAHLPTRLASGSQVIAAQLSRTPRDFVDLLGKLCGTRLPVPARLQPQVHAARPAPRPIPA
jgi:hypothetical protein